MWTGNCSESKEFTVSKLMAVEIGYKLLSVIDEGVSVLCLISVQYL
jgi:hypothetical protein